MNGFQHDLEEQYGIPIVMDGKLTRDSFGGTTRPYWEQRTQIHWHSIALAPRDPWLRPHALAHELTHIALECEAHAAGRRKTHCLLQPSYERLLRHCQPLKPGDDALLKKLFSYSFNVAADLVVEWRLQSRFPVLAPAQFVSAHRFEEKNREHHLGTLDWDVSPRLRLAFDAHIAVRSLFVDRTMPGHVRHFDRFDGTPAGDLAMKLYAEFQAIPNPGPGEHYLLVDRFAEMVDLPGLHDCVQKPVFELNAPISA